MPIDFEGQWAQEVADVSGLREYQNANIIIWDNTKFVKTGSVKDGYTWDKSAGKIWEGQARISSTRSEVGAGGTTSTNPTSIKSMRVQVPYSKDFTRVRRGWTVQVTSGGRNDRLMDYLFVVDSDVNSSQVGSVTFNCSVDVEAEASWTI